MKTLFISLFAALFLTASPSFAGNLAKDMGNIFSDMSTIRVEEVGKQVMVFGEVDSFKDFQKIQRIVGAIAEKGEPVALSVTLSSAGKELLAKTMEQAIGPVGVQVRSVGESFVLEGICANEFEADRAVETLRAHLNYPMKADIRSLSSGPHWAFGIVDMLRVAPRALKPKK